MKSFQKHIPTIGILLGLSIAIFSHASASQSIMALADSSNSQLSGEIVWK